MSREILTNLNDNIKKQYDLIPYANWDGSEKGPRPAPYAGNQTYPGNHPFWTTCDQDRVGIRLGNLVLVDYDGNKPEAIGEIPTVDELASALGFVSQQELFDNALIQWNDEKTSLHFLFLAPPEFNTTEFKQSNQGTKEHFWKHIDLKTGNQLVYLKVGKTSRLLDVQTYPPAPMIVIDQLRDKAIKTLAADFNHEIQASQHQIDNAEEWLHEALHELENTEGGSRNGTLNILACTASGLVAGGVLDNQASYTLLHDAAIEAGLDRSETLNTLNSGWAEGFKTPRRDAPYVKSCKPLSEVFTAHRCDDTNIDSKADSELLTSIQTGLIDESDPNIGVLHQHYTYFIENWVMNREGRYIDVRNLADYNKAAFNAIYGNDMPVKPGSKSFKKFIPSEVFEMANPTVVFDTLYQPGAERLFQYESVPYLNSYIAYEPERPSDDEINNTLRLIYQHLDWLFEDPTHQRLVLDWMAWQVQNVGSLVGWVPLVIGCRGDGKSLLFGLVTAALGSRNTKLMGNKSVNSDYQDWAQGAAVTAFEEIKVESRDSRRIANDLKPFITERRVTVNPKGKAEHTIPNFTNYVAFSNEPDPIAIASGDRRWLVLHTNHFGKNSVIARTQTDMKDHFDQINDLVNHEINHSAIHWALRNHEVSDFFMVSRFRAPSTEFSRELTEQTASEKENRLQEYLDNAYFTDGRRERLIECECGFQIQDFRVVMPENWFQGMDKKPSSIMLGKWLRNLGYEQAKRQQVSGEWLKTFKKV